MKYSLKYYKITLRTWLPQYEKTQHIKENSVSGFYGFKNQVYRDIVRMFYIRNIFYTGFMITFI